MAQHLRKSAFLASAALLLASSAAFAAPTYQSSSSTSSQSQSYGSLPAVSGINGSLDALGGVAYDKGIGLVSGSITAPVFHSFGVQLDGSMGAVGDNFAKGGTLHAFYRDPTQFMFGATYEIGTTSDLEFIRYGLEGAFYAGKMTYALGAGHEQGITRTGEYTNLDVSWYLNDNLSVTPAFHNGDNHAWGAIGAEWQPHMIAELPNLSAFANTGAGNFGYAYALVGVRYAFGGDKALIKRDREDRVDSTLPYDFQNGFTGSWK